MLQSPCVNIKGRIFVRSTQAILFWRDSLSGGLFAVMSAEAANDLRRSTEAIKTLVAPSERLFCGWYSREPRTSLTGRGTRGRCPCLGSLAPGNTPRVHTSWRHYRSLPATHHVKIHNWYLGYMRLNFDSVFVLGFIAEIFSLCSLAIHSYKQAYICGRPYLYIRISIVWRN